MVYRVVASVPRILQLSGALDVWVRAKGVRSKAELRPNVVGIDVVPLLEGVVVAPIVVRRSGV